MTEYDEDQAGVPTTMTDEERRIESNRLVEDLTKFKFSINSFSRRAFETNILALPWKQK